MRYFEPYWLVFLRIYGMNMKSFFSAEVVEIGQRGLGKIDRVSHELNRKEPFWKFMHSGWLKNMVKHILILFTAQTITRKNSLFYV